MEERLNDLGEVRCTFTTILHSNDYRDFNGTDSEVMTLAEEIVAYNGHYLDCRWEYDRIGKVADFVRHTIRKYKSYGMHLITHTWKDIESFIYSEFENRWLMSFPERITYNKYWMMSQEDYKELEKKIDEL